MPQESGAPPSPVHPPAREPSQEASLDRIVLGLYDGPSGGAALLRGGEIVAIAEEDRISRRARVTGLPRAATQSVLRDAAMEGDAVQAVIVATRNATYAEGVGSAVRPPLLYRVTEALPSPPSVSQLIRDSFASARRRRIDEALRSEFGISCPVLFLDHHLAHAVGALFTLGLRDALVVSMDGGGDGVWCAVTEFHGGRPSRVSSESGSQSILGFLDEVCERLGVPEGLDRYRQLENLAARGTSIHYDQLERAFHWDDGTLMLNEGLFRSGGLLSRVRASARKEDVAASTLALAAEYVRRWVVHHYVRSEATTLVLAGDLFGIASMVRAVADAPEVDRLRVSMTPGDVGLPVAAAYGSALPDFLPDQVRRSAHALSTPFLGLRFTNAEIESTLEDERVQYDRRDSIEADAARALAEGRTVARFDGAAEIGDRGLGNRVVLRNPRGPLRRGRVGFSLVPGAYHAIVLEEEFEHFFRDRWDPISDLRGHPILITPTAEAADAMPDLVGWGGYMRVQTVTEESNPGLHRILREFQTWSGLPLLAAAPFRLPNEPLVSTPRDAIRVFRQLGADFAALGPYLVKSEHESGTHAPPVDSEKRAER